MVLLFNIVLIFLVLILLLCLIFCPYRWYNPKRMYEFDRLIPGSVGFPLLGHAIEVSQLKLEDIFGYLETKCKLNPRFGKVWMGGFPILILTQPEDLEVAMSSMQHIQKGLEYDSLIPWLSDGLLLSTGDKWRNRRKLLTPTFHFKILEDNVGPLNKHSRLMVRNILNAKGNEFEATELIQLCTMDIICETAMGVNLKAQDNESMDYVQATEKVSNYSMERSVRVWLHRSICFNLTTLAYNYYKQLKIIHSFSDNVIKNRKQSYMKNRNELFDKKRKAFLDCLIEMEHQNPGLFTHSDIKEEVDTFMFEGHDTTSSALNFAMFELARNPEIQEKAYQEQFEIFGDSDRDVNLNDLTEMIYLEKFIKETLRLYPSVPYVTRNLTHELNLKDIVIPKGVNIIICPFNLHRDPELYHDPLVFDPERFALDESSKRHPFSYIPFSAGPRNCIGQRFAMMELKIVLSHILRFTKLEAVTKREDFKLMFSVVLRATNPIKLKATKRNC